MNLIRITILILCLIPHWLLGVDLTKNTNKPTAAEEGLISAELIVTRGSGDTLGIPLVVNWEIIQLDVRHADEIDDYTISGALALNMTGTVTILANQSFAKITITPLQDTDIEGYETVTVRLLSGTGYVLTVNKTETVTITDNDLSMSLFSPINTAYEDFTPGPGTTKDPEINRRGVFRVEMSPVSHGLETIVNTAILPATSVGQATLNTDYNVVYKIGGNAIGAGLKYIIDPTHAYDLGATAIKINTGTIPIPSGSTVQFTGDTDSYTTTGNFIGGAGTITLTSGLTKALVNLTNLSILAPTPPIGFVVNQSTSPIIGATSVTVSSGSGAIAPGAKITFTGHATIYTTANGLASQSGTLTISPPLTDNVPDATVITVTYQTPTGYKVNQANSIVPQGAKQFTVKDGIGGFAVGDVFRISGNDSVQYVVTTGFAAAATGTVIFETFTGTGFSNGGIPSTISGSPEILTHFNAVFSPAPNATELRILIPGTATKIDYGIVPKSDTIIEASETVTMSLLTSTDYLLSNSGVDVLTITDDEIIVAFAPNPQNATVGGASGEFTVILTGGTFPRIVEVPYSLSGTAKNGESAPMANDSDIDPALTGFISIPANTASGIITVHAAARNDGVTENLILTLTETNDYRLAPTTGTPPNASATISINDSLGIVSIVPKPTFGIAAEAPITSVSGVFLFSIIRPAPGSGPAVSIPYTINGTSSATQGTDYPMLSGFVTIPMNIDFVELLITPSFDAIPEPTETVTLNLSNGFGYTTDLTKQSATITILDDEPVVSITKLTDITEGQNGIAVFNVSYVGNLSTSTLTVPLTFSGSASNPADYTPPNPAQVVFSNTGGVKNISVLIDAINDGDAEGEEAFTASITLDNTKYFRGTSFSAEANLINLNPTFTLTNINDTIEGGAVGRFRITSSFPPIKPIIVAYTIAPSSTATPGAAAGAGIDYQTLSGTVTVTGTTADITVTTFTDAIYEASESVGILLTDATPPRFAKASSSPLTATVNILDAQPNIISVSSSSSNGTYVAGNTLSITVLFSEAVTVTGSPTLTLETGTTDAVATLSSSSGSTATFTYTVRSTDISSNLDYVSPAALALNGGTIQKAATSINAHLLLPVPGATNSLGNGFARLINGGSAEGKPAPGAVSKDGGGGCGLGSGFATMLLLFMALGIRLRIFPKP